MSNKLLTPKEFISAHLVAGKTIKDERTLIKRLDKGIFPSNTRCFKSSKGWFIEVLPFVLAVEVVKEDCFGKSYV